MMTELAPGVDEAHKVAEKAGYFVKAPEVIGDNWKVVTVALYLTMEHSSL